MKIIYSDKHALRIAVVLSVAKDLTPAGDSVSPVRFWPLGKVLRYAQDDMT